MKNTFFKLSQTAFAVGCSALCALVSSTALANSDQLSNPMNRIQVGDLVRCVFVNGQSSDLLQDSVSGNRSNDRTISTVAG